MLNVRIYFFIGSAFLLLFLLKPWVATEAEGDLHREILKPQFQIAEQRSVASTKISDQAEAAAAVRQDIPVGANEVTEQKKFDTQELPVSHEQAMAAVHAKEIEVFNTAAKLFQGDELDSVWATEHEKILYDIFATQSGLDRISLSHIECRSTMCQILVYTPQSRDADYFSAMFYQGLEDYQDGRYKTTAAIARNMANGITAVYVSRKNHTLAFYR